MAKDDGRHREELRSFLRAARARLDPSELGIPATSRRRSKGLRIEDLCTFAGVGITWYSALESGKPVNVSRRMLAGIADVLRLTEDERHYLYALVEYEEPPQREPDDGLRKTLARMVLRIDIGPSLLLDERWDVIAYNEIADRVYDFSSRKEPGNFAERMFLDPNFRALHTEWEENARRLTATLKMHYAFARDRARFDRLVRSLQEGSEAFAAFWEQPAVEEHRPKIARLVHPVLGPLTLEFVALQQAERWRSHSNDTVLLQIPVDGTRL